MNGTHQGEERPGGHGIRLPAIYKLYARRNKSKQTLRILINEQSELGTACLTAAIDSLDQRDCSCDLVPDNLVIILTPNQIPPSCCFPEQRYSIQTAI